MNSYLNQNVIFAGGGPEAAGPLRFALSPGQFAGFGTFITGCLVLVIGEAFRQGLRLKAENDLTV